MAAITTDDAIRHVTPSEQSIPYMYLDTSTKEGGPFVTVGIGVVIDSAAQLGALLDAFEAWELPPDGKGKPAKRGARLQELLIAYQQVARWRDEQRALGQKGYVASAFAEDNDVTTAEGQTVRLRLADGADLKLAKSRADKLLASLRTLFPAFDAFPRDAQLALFDMAFNMGVGERAATRKKSTGLQQFWNLVAAVKERNWKRAADECRRRPPVSERRNLETKVLFLLAAKEDPLGSLTVDVGGAFAPKDGAPWRVFDPTSPVRR